MKNIVGYKTYTMFMMNCYSENTEKTVSVNFKSQEKGGSKWNMIPNARIV